jgi:uncharacterized membrane protein
METIATYSEKRFDGKRTFTLLADAIVVSGSATLSSEFQARIPLSSLDPNYSTLCFRNRSFWAGAWMVVISFVVCTILVSGFNMFWATKPVVMVALIGITGFLLCLATARKVEFIRFTTQGGVVGLDLARSGPEREKLDAFIDALTKQIRVARGAA